MRLLDNRLLFVRQLTKRGGWGCVHVMIPSSQSCVSLIVSNLFSTDLHCRMSQTLRWEAGRITFALVCKRETWTRNYLSSAFTAVVGKCPTLFCLMFRRMPSCWPELFVYFQCFTWKSAAKLANALWMTYCPRGMIHFLEQCSCPGHFKNHINLDTWYILCLYYFSVNLSQAELGFWEINSNGNYGKANIWLKRSD